METDEQKPPWKCVSFFSNTHTSEILFGAWPEITVDPALQNSKDKIALYEKYHVWELAKKMANPYECIYT